MQINKLSAKKLSQIMKIADPSHKGYLRTNHDPDEKTGSFDNPDKQSSTCNKLYEKENVPVDYRNNHFLRLSLPAGAVSHPAG